MSIDIDKAYGEGAPLEFLVLWNDFAEKLWPLSFDAQLKTNSGDVDEVLWSRTQENGIVADIHAEVRDILDEGLLLDRLIPSVREIHTLKDLDDNLAVIEICRALYFLYYKPYIEDWSEDFIRYIDAELNVPDKFIDYQSDRFLTIMEFLNAIRMGETEEAYSIVNSYRDHNKESLDIAQGDNPQVLWDSSEHISNEELFLGLSGSIDDFVIRAAIDGIVSAIYISTLGSERKQSLKGVIDDIRHNLKEKSSNDLMRSLLFRRYHQMKIAQSLFMYADYKEIIFATHMFVMIADFAKDDLSLLSAFKHIFMSEDIEMQEANIPGIPRQYIVNFRNLLLKIGVHENMWLPLGYPEDIRDIANLLNKLLSFDINSSQPYA